MPGILPSLAPSPPALATPTCFVVELQSAHRFMAASARNRTRGTAPAQRRRAAGQSRWRSRFPAPAQPPRRPPAAAGLFPLFQHSIDLAFDQPDRRGPAYRADSGLAFAVAKSEFPPPSAAIRQLNDRIFDASVIHRMCSHHHACERPKRLAGAGNNHQMTGRYVHLCT